MHVPSPVFPKRGVLLTAAGLLVVVTIGCVIWIGYSKRTNVAIDAVVSTAKRPAVAVPVDLAPVETTSSVGIDFQEEAELEVSPSPHSLDLQRGRFAWEIRIDALLAQQIPDARKAEQLLKELPVMPPEAYGRLVQESVDRLPDKDYTSVVLPVLLNPATDGAAESVLYADLLERPDYVTLPALLSLARTPSHPFAQSARETLALLLEKDFDTDWQRWEAAVAQRLTRSPAAL